MNLREDKNINWLKGGVIFWFATSPFVVLLQLFQSSYSNVTFLDLVTGFTLLSYPSFFVGFVLGAIYKRTTDKYLANVILLTNIVLGVLFQVFLIKASVKCMHVKSMCDLELLVIITFGPAVVAIVGSVLGSFIKAIADNFRVK